MQWRDRGEYGEIYRKFLWRLGTFRRKIQWQHNSAHVSSNLYITLLYNKCYEFYTNGNVYIGTIWTISDRWKSFYHTKVWTCFTRSRTPNCIQFIVHVWCDQTYIFYSHCWMNKTTAVSCAWINSCNPWIFLYVFTYPFSECNAG